MLNYIWAGLLLVALIFALVSDGTDLLNHVYANGLPLSATIAYRGAGLGTSRDAAVDVHISSAAYAQHFRSTETLAASYPATLTHLHNGYQLHFDKLSALPAKLSAMRDFSDAKELTAAVEGIDGATDREVAARLFFPAVRFVKLRAMTAAAIDMAQTAVELSLKLVGVLALWLGLMKIAEASGLIDLMVRIIQPVLRPIFPSIPPGHPAMGYIAINLAGNILGLGNATTAMGLKAMEELQKLNPTDDTATDPMVMLLAIHTAAFQLVPPATLVALMGFEAARIFVPMLLVGFIATLIAILSAKLLGRLPIYRRTNPHFKHAAVEGAGS